MVDISRQQQEARSWIAHWRGRSWSGKSASAGHPETDKVQTETAKEIREMKSTTEDGEGDCGIRKMEETAIRMREEMEDALPEQQHVVAAVFAALDRAQRAAEEAAASSTALELAIEQAESAGALSSSEDDDEEGDGVGGGGGGDSSKP